MTDQTSHTDCWVDIGGVRYRIEQPVAFLIGSLNQKAVMLDAERAVYISMLQELMRDGELPERMRTFLGWDRPPAPLN